MTAPTQALLHLATSDGARWAVAVRDRLQSEGRRATGMWPGTFSEARARASRLLAGKFEGGTPRELREAIAKTLYAAARADWREFHEPEEELA